MPALRRKNKSGFTIVEVLMSMSILSIISVSLMGMQSTFSNSTNRRQVSNLLGDIADDQMSRCLSGQSLSASPVKAQNNTNIYFSVSGSCTPLLNQCNNITITSTNINTSGLSGDALTKALNKSQKVTLQSYVCNFK